MLGTDEPNYSTMKLQKPEEHGYVNRDKALQQAKEQKAHNFKMAYDEPKDLTNDVKPRFVSNFFAAFKRCFRLIQLI
jgi:hypothetical protein